MPNFRSIRFDWAEILKMYVFVHFKGLNRSYRTDGNGGVKNFHAPYEREVDIWK